MSFSTFGKTRFGGLSSPVSGIKGFSSTRAFGSAGQAGDEFFDNVSLLILTNESVATTTFVDRSNNNNTLTPLNGLTTSIAQYKFGGSSIYIPGGSTGDILRCGSGISDFGTDDFTIEMWVYYISGSAYFFSTFDTPDFQAPTGLRIYISGGTTYISRGNVFNWFVSSATLPTNEWAHLAITREGDTLRVFLNGTLSGTKSTAGLSWGGNNTYVGGYNITSSASRVNSYIDSVRITKGVSRYNATFDAPTESFPTS